MIHAVLMDVLGLGVLIVGESGIGKSECALDLIVRGHRLVADDTVEVRRRQETILIGACPELTRHHMELRGLGVINIKELFGIASTRSSKRVELVVQLERWDADARVRAARARRCVLRDPRAARAAAEDAGGARAATSPSWSRSRRAISCCGQRGHHAARELAERLDARCASRRCRRRRTKKTRRSSPGAGDDGRKSAGPRAKGSAKRGAQRRTARAAARRSGHGEAAEARPGRRAVHRR